jgi:membrane protein
LTISALLLVVAGGKIADRLASVYGFQSTFTMDLRAVPIAIGFMILSFALIYYFALDSREQSWKWLSPGSAVGVLLWLLVSFGLKGHLHSLILITRRMVRWVQ